MEYNSSEIPVDRFPPLSLNLSVPLYGSFSMPDAVSLFSFIAVFFYSKCLSIANDMFSGMQYVSFVAMMLVISLQSIVVPGFVLQ